MNVIPVKLLTGQWTILTRSDDMMPNLEYLVDLPLLAVGLIILIWAFRGRVQDTRMQDRARKASYVHNSVREE